MRSTFIHIEDLRVDCLIGVWSHERKKTQQIRVDLVVEFDAFDAAKHDELDHTLNYADLARDVVFLLEKGQFRLLESAVWMLQRWLLLPPAATGLGHLIRSVDVRLTKFGALPGSTLAAVQSKESASEVDYAREQKPWGSVDVVGETSKVGVYRLNILPGQVLPPHFHSTMRESELILSPGLDFIGQTQERPLSCGEEVAWPKAFVHGYRNTSDKVASLLCIDAPPFMPQDEQVIDL